MGAGGVAGAKPRGGGNRDPLPMSHRIPIQPPRILAAAGVARRAGQDCYDLVGFVSELAELVCRQPAQWPQFDRYVSGSQRLAGAKTLVAVRDHEAPADSDYGNRREPLTFHHRLAVALDLFRGVGGGEKIDQLRGWHHAGRKFGAGRIETDRRRIRSRRVIR